MFIIPVLTKYDSYTIVRLPTHKEKPENMKVLMRPALFFLLPIYLFGASIGTAKSSEDSAQPTAKAHLAAATAAARKWQADVVLVAIETNTANPDGGAYTWSYIYDSPKAGDQILIMIDDKGEVSQLPGFATFRNPIGDFVDSDQAMAAAVAAGLKTDTFGMTMSLNNSGRTEWSIPGPVLSYKIDAATGKLLSKE